MGTHLKVERVEEHVRGLEGTFEGRIKGKKKLAGTCNRVGG